MTGKYEEQGADISWWQGPVDYVKMKAAGIKFLFIRAGAISKSGEMYMDYALPTHLMYVQDHFPCRVGYYWFYREFGFESAKAQARVFWNLVKDHDHSEGLVCDAESAAMKWSSIFAFMTELKRLSGLPDKKLGIYTRANLWNRIIQLAPGADRFFLWVARWHLGLDHPWQDSNYYRAKPWVHAEYWQKEGDGNRKGHAYGVESHDLDIDWRWVEEDIPQPLPPPAVEPEKVKITYDPRHVVISLNPIIGVNS